MPNLSASQTAVLRSIFGAAPDTALNSLERALRDGSAKGSAMAGVYDLISHEAVERHARATVFSPVVKLCASSQIRGVRFPPAIISLLWSAARAGNPQLADQAKRLTQAKTEDPQDCEVYDQLCAAAAAGLRLPAAEYAVAVDCLDRAQPGGAALFASYLDLAPLTRATMARLPEWITRMTEERAAASRVAYKDAVALADDAGPKFFEMLYANLSEPWLILRVLSAVMDRPTDSYAAVSELARFGVYILDDIDRRLDCFAKTDFGEGAKAGVGAADQVHAASLEICEFDTSLEISREGPWGRRLIAQKQKLAQLAENRLAQVDKVLDAALPLEPVRFGNGLRGQPRLTLDPDAGAIRKAEGLLGFVEHSRAAASQAGYGSSRAKAMEKIDARIGQYVQDLLEHLRAEPPEETAPLARSFLEAAAKLTAITQGAKAGQIVRRRAAAA